MKVENSVIPTQEQMEGFLTPGPDGPISMVNLLKFKEKADYKDGRETELNGQEAYALYSRGVMETGKNVGDDLNEGKPTLPLIHAMQHASSTDAELIADAVRTKSAEHLAEIIELAVKTGGIAETRSAAEACCDLVNEGLATLAPSAAKTSLETLATFSLSRES